MRNNDQRFFARVMPGEEEATSTAEDSSRRPRVRGIAGQLRPYREVRAGFEPWRRVALKAWVSREESTTAH